MQRLGITLYCLSGILAGCTRTVTVEVTKYVPVPPSLTRPCLHDASPETNAELLEAYEEARSVLAECNSRLDEIRKLK